jgi:uncharacterized protein involved in type VI secretion and phage assembly
MTNEISLESLGIAGAPVIEADGAEAIGRSPELAIAFLLGDGGPEPEALVGATVKLVLGDRALGGVLVEVERGEQRESGERVYRATLAPRTWLLSRGRTSRIFERLSAPEIAEAVVVASGLDLRVDLRLRDTYPARPHTVQHRESDLDFVSRVLAREGITLLARDDGERAHLVLVDRNEAWPDAGELANVTGLRTKTALLPRRIELASVDPARPELPLRAEALVSERGAGDLEIHDIPFSTPEEGARMARLHAERLRAEATEVRGTAPRPLAAGTRARVEGREVLITAVRNTLSANGAWQSTFTAIPASVPLRPALAGEAPRVVGLQSGKIAARENGYRVREAGTAAERAMPAAANGAFDREPSEGAHVIWGCLDGDPERPILTAVLASSSAGEARALMRGPRGAILEMGGARAPDLGAAEGLLESRHGAAPVPAIAHHSTDTGTYESDSTSATNTWMRIAVPHSNEDTWSYLRVGEAADTEVTGTDSTVSFTESTSGLELNDGNLDGIYDYTDKNRTTITKGKWEHVVKGKGRMVVHGKSGKTNYEMNVTDALCTINANTPVYSYSDGFALNAFGGIALDVSMGSQVNLAVGGSFGVDVGFLFNATAGYKLDYVHADSYECRKGEELSNSSTIDKRASELIQFSITQDSAKLSNETKLAAAIAAAGSIGIMTAGELGTAFTDNYACGASTAAVTAAAMLATYAVMRARSDEADLEDGNPILSIAKEPTANKGMAVARADDWLLMLSADFAVLGKNMAYADEKTVANLTFANAGAGLIIDESGGKKPEVTLQAGKDNFDPKSQPSADKWARIKITEKGITILADTITIEGVTSADKAAVTINGTLEVNGKVTVKKDGLDVTGDSMLKGVVKGGAAGNIEVAK